MPGAAKTTAELNAILGGGGAVDLAEAVVALAGATGIVAFTKKIGLWPKFSPVEKHEMELLDADMPDGWFRRVKETVTASTLTGKRVRWRHGLRSEHATGWSVGTDDDGNLALTTPMLDEATDQLV